MFPSRCSGRAAGVPGEQEEAVPESGSAGQAEERAGAGQESPPHRQELRRHDGGGAQRQACGHQQGERTALRPLSHWGIAGSTPVTSSLLRSSLL